MKQNLTHVNDMNERDCCIVAYPDEKKYILYSSRPMKGQTKRQINIRESDDLIWWTDPVCAFAPDDDYWGPLDFWAPEGHYWKGKYYAVSSFRAKGGYRGCQFLVADTPRGPFVPMVNKPATTADWHCLDGTLYEDKNGDPWMVFCHEWQQVQDGQMAAIRMKDDLSDSIGDPIILFRASEAPWKFTDPIHCWDYTEPQPAIGWGRITDGPWLHRMQNGKLVMVWSSFSETGYTIGQCYSASGDIQGPWTQEPEPIFSLDGGHPMMFRTFEGKLLLAAHSPNISGKERLILFEMDDSGDKLKVINEITGNWLPNRYFPDGNMKGMTVDATRRQPGKPVKGKEGLKKSEKAVAKAEKTEEKKK